jgi:hypothetical protein
LLSSGAVSVERAIPPRRASNADFAWCMPIKTYSKSWAATISARVAQDGAFKKCCLRSGEYDGSNRNYFFPQIIQTVGPMPLLASGPVHSWVDSRYRCNYLLILKFCTCTLDPPTLFGGGSQPVLLPSCRKSLVSAANRRLQGWFNTACFAAPSYFTFSAEPRVNPTLRFDSVSIFDVALFESVFLGESDRSGLEFRVEFFNLLDRAQFAPPDTTCCTSNDANFGVATSRASGTNPRLIQFASKFFF